MQAQKYSISQPPIDVLLSWVKSGEIAIPEIQRPFVWNSTMVRNLIDSLYSGFPIGYLIVWRNPNIKLKDGRISEGKKILIDGQQRITALTAAVLGQQVVDKNYRKVKIQIAFNPMREPDAGFFEVFNPAIAKDVSWIPDISPIILGTERVSKVVKDYCANNPTAEEAKIEDAVENLKLVMSKQVGVIELDHELDIETVTEIFIRVNNEGVMLSQADFVMSKIASNEEYNGSNMRKCIDYFCHMAVAPEFYAQITDVDKEFTGTEYFRRMTWLKDELDDLYDPSYSDLLRVAFTSEFSRGKLSDLVSLLSGRNFVTRTYEAEIAKESFARLENGIFNFMDETNFKRFLMIIKSSGFIAPELVRSRNTLNFAYIVYLKLQSLKYASHEIGKYVTRWFVLSILTGRYSSSPESAFDLDIRNMSEKDFKVYLETIENGELSDAFWDVALVQNMDTSVASSPYFNTYLAAQVKANDSGFLSKDITVRDLISHRGDIHHVFPREYLKGKGLKRGEYNQIANYVYMQSEINVKIGKKSPKDYFEDLKKQCNGGRLKYGGIDDEKALMENLRMNCIPESIFDMEIDDYNGFLVKRRQLIAKKLKKYYFSL